MNPNPQSFIYKSFSIISSIIRMNFRAIFFALIILMVIQLILVIFLVKNEVLTKLDHVQEFKQAFYQSIFRPNSTVRNDLGQGEEISVNDYVNLIYEDWALKFKVVPGYFLRTSYVYLFLLVYIYLLKIFSKKINQKIHIRGPHILSVKELMKELKARGEPLQLPIGETLLPKSAECNSIMFVGPPGVGKTVALSQILKCLIDQDVKIVILDGKGELVSKFYDPNSPDHMIFNPLDVRHVGYSLSSDWQTDMDLENFGHSIFAEGSSDSGKYFNAAGRSVTRGEFVALFKAGKLKNQDIWDALISSPEEILALLKTSELGRAAARHIENIGDRQSQGVLGTIENGTKSFYYLNRTDGPFSIRDWVQNGKGIIFLSNRPEFRESIRPIISIFIDMLMYSLLPLPDDPNRRIFLLLDEFATLYPLTSLVRLMELGRSKGVGIFLGCQDINQIKTLYQESAQTILNLCSTTVCFRPNSVETAKYYESFFGKREVSLVQESHSLGPGKGKDSVQITRRNHVEELLLASELQQLPNMKAYIKIQHHDPALITIPKRFFEDKQESFIMAPWLKLENQRHLPVEPKKKPAQEKSHLEF